MLSLRIIRKNIETCFHRATTPLQNKWKSHVEPQNHYKNNWKRSHYKTNKHHMLSPRTIRKILENAPITKQIKVTCWAPESLEKTLKNVSTEQQNHYKTNENHMLSPRIITKIIENAPITKQINITCWAPESLEKY